MQYLKVPLHRKIQRDIRQSEKKVSVRSVKIEFISIMFENFHIDKIYFTERTVMMGNNTFTRWMNSRDPEFSLWSNKEYCKPLLSYIGKIYGQKDKIRRVLDPLRIEYNTSEELDQLYAIIKELEKQPGSFLKR